MPQDQVSQFFKSIPKTKTRVMDQDSNSKIGISKKSNEKEPRNDCIETFGNKAKKRAES